MILPISGEAGVPMPKPRAEPPALAGRSEGGTTSSWHGAPASSFSSTATSVRRAEQSSALYRSSDCFAAASPSASQRCRQTRLCSPDAAGSDQVAPSSAATVFSPREGAGK
jgi:hypothetical protein